MRVAMALVMLVAWSPAWCCCGIRATLDWAQSGTDDDECRTVPAAMCPHCAAGAQTAAAPDGGATPSGDRDPCRCHDQGREAMSKGDDRAAAIDLLGSALAVIAAMPPASTQMRLIDAARPAIVAAARGEPPSPPSSLVAIHCMLTT